MSIDTTGEEVPRREVSIGAQILFTPNPGFVEQLDQEIRRRGHSRVRGLPPLYPDKTHLGIIIGTRRGRPILRIFHPDGSALDPTIEFTGSEGSWRYLDEDE